MSKADVTYYDFLTAFQVMVKPFGPICNLNCTYCYYLEKENLYKNTRDFRLPENILESFIRQHIEGQSVPHIQFVWQGGEPTMLGIAYYEKAIEIQNRYAGKKKIENVLQTNGTLLDQDWARFLKKHDFLVGVSIDGPREIHDHYRVNKAGQPTWERVMGGIEALRKAEVRFNTLTVVNNYNADYPLEIYRFLKRIGSGFMQFIPIVEQLADDSENTPLKLVSPHFKGKAAISPWSVQPEKFGRFLVSIFDEWVRSDVGRYYVQHFDVALANTVGVNPGLCVFTEVCGDATAIEHNGDLYSCDHFVYPENYLGNILETPLVEMIKSPQQIRFGMNKRDSLPRECRECEVYYLCHGECPKNRTVPKEDGGLQNYLCEGYKMFFKHVEPYMKFMAKELENKRPPANVMHWIREQAADKALLEVEQRKPKEKVNTRVTVGRNDPCPCGSGKPFKACCRNKKKE